MDRKLFSTGLLALCLGMTSALPLAAQDRAAPATLLAIASLDGCDGPDILASLVTAENARVSLTLSDMGKAAGRKKRRDIKVRRGSEVSTSAFGFSATEEAPAPRDETIDLSAEIEAILCQTRTSATFIAGTWSLKGEKDDIKLALEGRFPSDEMTLESIAFTAREMSVTMSVLIEGELMAEDPRRLSLSGDARLAIPSASGE